MRKADDLRALLAAHHPDLTRNPDLFWIEVREGRICATATAAYGYEWTYTLELTLLDATLNPDALFLLINEWLKSAQPDLVQPGGPGYAFEAERIDSEKIDLVVRVRLTEPVAVTIAPDGTPITTHPPEPDYAALLGDTPLAGQTAAPPLTAGTSRHVR